MKTTIIVFVLGFAIGLGALLGAIHLLPASEPTAGPAEVSAEDRQLRRDLLREELRLSRTARSFLVGITSAMLSQFTDSSAAAKESAQASDLHTLRSQVQLYRAKEGSYPDSLDALVGDYVESLPTDPITELPYLYDPKTGEVTAPPNPDDPQDS